MCKARTLHAATLALGFACSFSACADNRVSALLDPQTFWQVHRGTIVNSRFIVAAKRDELGRVELIVEQRSECILVSRQFAHLFRQM